MHDRAVTAKAANDRDRKARNEPSDIGKDYRKKIEYLLEVTKLFKTA